MRKEGIIEDIIEAIQDPEREFTERMFLALTMVSEITVFIALLGDLITRENPGEIAVLAAILMIVPILTYSSFRTHKLKGAIRITVVLLLFIILPALFFFGGGVEGGGVLWIVFAFTYVGLLLTGTWRSVMLIVLFMETIGFYVAEYLHPVIVNDHPRWMFYLDSCISIVLVGFVCFVMNRIQNGLFMSENARAREAAEKAEELTRAQNRFFSSMSHEIRTPINSILGLNELILRDQAASDEIVRDASGIQGSGKMLLALINDILDFSKMEAGSMDIVPVDYHIGDMISEIVNMIWIRANDKGLRFHVSIDPEVPSVVYGDEVRIKQVVVNLLNNAVKYTSNGYVELHVESEEIDDKTVELTISVADTGMGIKKEALPYLFDAFKRVDEERNRHIEGTGLGLSIVKQLVELMDGTITVNSIYGEGSTFTVVVKQGISDHTSIGELNIHSHTASSRSVYESSFRAPDARILIVDDNEMNLEVESKLLFDTEMTIDKALSGREALELSLKYRYEVILMDHLMPEMDGIDCLERLRIQVGGLNRSTPVVVLTANAGSENKELYKHSGFDGYLVKPVSGEALENMIVKYIPAGKLIMNSQKMTSEHEDISTLTGYSGKAPIIITSTSMCDLPDSIIKKLHIPILPFRIRTEEGVFKDSVQMDADELIRYLNSGKNAVSMPPDEAAYTDFFAASLKHAHHLIHIALTTSMSDDYKVACEAAKAFDNVTVINSESVSSSTGILVMIAYKLAQMNSSVDEIVAELETIKKRLMCSFIIDTTEYMAQRGFISQRVHRFAEGLNLHPCLTVRDDATKIGGIWMGNRKRAYKNYINKAFPVDIIPDPEVVFITYADVSIDTLMFIKDEISKLAYFEHFIFQQASAAISSNCGPGSFGILYFVKSNKSYNLSAYVEEESALPYEKYVGEELSNDDIEEDTQIGYGSLLAIPEPEEPKWYETIEGIDPAAAIQNSGSEDAFKTVLKIFYDSIEPKNAELEGFYSAEDWENYTIKIHALKSSAKLIGAMETSEKALRLETAGKEADIDYIRANHESFMEEYRGYKALLAPVFGDDLTADEPEDDDRPLADDCLMQAVYEGLAEAADMMDSDGIEEVMEELDAYVIPESEKEKVASIKEMIRNYDYEGIVTLLKE